MGYLKARNGFFILYKINLKEMYIILKVLSVCSGIEAFLKALENLKINHEVINYCEIDKYAAKACSLLHNIPESKNLNDITKINITALPKYNILVGGTPCTNISKVGNKQGLKGEESQLFYNYAEVLNNTLPEYFIFENVDNLKTINQGKDWEIVQQELSKNYNIYADIMDAKNYNIPQSRKRLIVIGIRNDIKQDYKFPEKEELKISFTELLEKEVNPKYYLSQRERQYMDRETKDGRNHWDFMHYHDTKDMYSHCIVANTFKGVPYNVLADRRNCKYGFYDCDFIDKGSDFCNSCTSGDCMQLNNNVTSGERKLTPMECFRLMGFDDKDYYILKENNISDTQLFKMAGNSIPVLVLEKVFKNLLLNN